MCPDMQICLHTVFSLRWDRKGFYPISLIVYIDQLLYLPSNGRATWPSSGETQSVITALCLLTGYCRSNAWHQGRSVGTLLISEVVKTTPHTGLLEVTLKYCPCSRPGWTLVPKTASLELLVKVGIITWFSVTRATKQQLIAGVFSCDLTKSK